MTVSRCEIIISRFAITISHLEINFTTPSGINPLAATTIPHNSTIIPQNSTIKPHNSATIPRNSTIKPHNSTTIPHISTTIPRATTIIPRTANRLGVITPMPLPCPTTIEMAVNWLSLPPTPPTTPTDLAMTCGESVKMGAEAIKSGTNTINRAPTALIMYII